MIKFLWLVPTFPLISFAVLAILNKKISKPSVRLIGVGSVGLSALLTLLIGQEFKELDTLVFRQTLWSWIPMEDTPIQFSLYLDALSMVMISIVTGVGFLIHWYASAYMMDDNDYSRFFAYMNLFVFAMLMLVLGDSLVLLYLGWEGVGLCSFLLIGFWYKEPENAQAATKAFIVTRVGDTAMFIGLMLLFKELATLDIQAVLGQATHQWQADSDVVWWACMLLLGGAVGKSAQLPLQTWLPDAMAGPTPVSALIHAATMVTAGVYLIARMHPLFLMSSQAMEVVAWVGALTLLLAGFAALAQSDIKRVLAYSTVSQIGYMFLGLGAGGWALSIFHLMTHAFFKALLFMIAGSIILKLHHQQDIFKMGGLAKRLPLTCLMLLIGLIALTAIPGTSGFFSKEAILAAVWNSETAGPTLWWIGIAGAFMTSLYSFRMFFIVCFGQENGEVHGKDYPVLSHFVLPLLPLALLALMGGFMAPDLSSVFPATAAQDSPAWTHWLAIAGGIAGIALAYVLFYPRPNATAPKSGLNTFLQQGLGFDWLYHRLFEVPYKAIARLNKSDVVDSFYNLIVWFSQTWHQLFSITQNGNLRWYAAGLAFGSAVILGAALWLM